MRGMRRSTVRSKIKQSSVMEYSCILCLHDSYVVAHLVVAFIASVFALINLLFLL